MNTLGTILFVILLLAFAIFGVAGCGSLASEGRARDALVTQGFSNIHFDGRDIFLVSLRGCNRDDDARFNYTATNALGNRVKVHVCQDWPFGGSTVRR